MAAFDPKRTFPATIGSANRLWFPRSNRGATLRVPKSFARVASLDRSVRKDAARSAICREQYSGRSQSITYKGIVTIDASPITCASSGLNWAWGLAVSDENAGGRERFPVKIKCPRCKQIGSAIWEEAARPNPEGLKPTLISLPVGFYHRARKDLAGLPELVCDDCQTVILD